MALPPLGPDSHVLVLSAADLELLKDLAGRARLVVALAQDPASLRAARRTLAGQDNVMVAPWDPADPIPWQEQYFDLVVDPAGGWADPDRVEREARRVLLPDGRLQAGRQRT
jgi:SAM-dependent methyltransferase